MIGLAEFFLGLLAVLEAEGRELRENFIILTRRWFFLLAGLCLFAAGLIFLIIAVYKGLSCFLSPLAVLLIMSLFCFLSASIIIYSSSSFRKKKTEKPQAKSKTVA